MKKFLLRMAEYNCMESSINKLSQMNASIPRLIIGNKIIGEGNPVFFIAEIGQNHQGDVNIAKKLIDAAKESGADCVKLQKTDLNEKFTKQILDREYNSPNSWGRTYGEHKQYLEFSEDQFLELQQYAKCKDILFTASAMDLKSLDFLLNIDVPFVKIGSGDSNNIELIMKAAQSEVPIIISTGMLTFESVKKLDLIFRKYNKNNYALLHCVSAYPTPLEDVNLKVIELYRGCFPDIIIGYSGHELGIDVSIAATVMGAQVSNNHGIKLLNVDTQKS
ncbi:hypothetical protein HHI36_013646 [Cryptolaemus montrouzieri]|uniref:PseI/NeuA/B-like domain-containing protein n=1 Tax=Cryptolaemus montrouzieri TaxID=559131 RepID=A0ABD2NIT6_9CUCU